MTCKRILLTRIDNPDLGQRLFVTGRYILFPSKTGMKRAALGLVVIIDLGCCLQGCRKLSTSLAPVSQKYDQQDRNHAEDDSWKPYGHFYQGFWQLLRCHFSAGPAYGAGFRPDRGRS